MNTLNHQTTLAFVRRTLAADFACAEACFSQAGVFLTEAKEMPGRRRFPFRAKSFNMMTMGASVVITCSADRLAWAQTQLSYLDRNTLFSIATFARLTALVASDDQFMAGPDPKFICARDTFRPAPTPMDVSIELVTAAQMPALYTHTGFYNALGYQLASPRPDVLATVARRNQTVVGIAGASADSDDLWQIGVDVVPAYQGRGIGKALVSELTAAVLAAGKVPYYTAALSNLRSSHVALSLGYWLAWLEVYALEQ